MRLGPSRCRISIPSFSASSISNPWAGISRRFSRATMRTRRAPIRMATRATSSVTVAAASTPSASCWAPASGCDRPAAISRSAVRATSRATFPPPITTTSSPSSTRYPAFALIRKSTALSTPSSSTPGTCKSRLRMAPTAMNTAANPSSFSEDGADLGLQNLPAQAVRGDPEDHHAAGPVRGVQDDRTVAVRCEVVGAGEAGRPGPHDGYPIVPARHHLHRLAPQALALRALHTSAITGEPLQRTDRDGLVDVAAAARGFTGGSANPATDRREWIRHARDEVRELVVPGGDGGDVTPRVGEDGACPGARNVVVQPLRPNRNGLEAHAATFPPYLGAARTTSS